MNEKIFGFKLMLVLILSVYACRLQAKERKTQEPIIGMYIHQHWPFKRPYAARTWTIDDWQGYVSGLCKLGYNTIQVWPMLETMPQPLTPSDKNNLVKIAKVIDMAHDLDMRVYLAISANVIPNDALAAQAVFEARHFFHCDLRVNPADKKAVQQMMTRRKELFQPVAKTDGISIIDSDPGGYPGSTNEEFIYLLGEHRRMLDSLRSGIELIYWLHAGWPAYSEYYQTNRFRWGKIAALQTRPGRPRTTGGHAGRQLSAPHAYRYTTRPVSAGIY